MFYRNKNSLHLNIIFGEMIFNILIIFQKGFLIFVLILIFINEIQKSSDSSMLIVYKIKIC